MRTKGASEKSDILGPETERVPSKLEARILSRLIADTTVTAPQRALGKAANLRKHRHKRVAHSDYETHFTEGESLPIVSRQIIEEALCETEKFLGTFDFYFSNVEMLYDVLSPYNGAEILLTKLVKGQVYEDLEKNQTIPHGTWRHFYRDI